MSGAGKLTRMEHMLRHKDSNEHAPKQPGVGPRAWQRLLTIILAVALLASLPGLSLANDNPAESSVSQTAGANPPGHANESSNAKVTGGAFGAPTANEVPKP